MGARMRPGVGGFGQGPVVRGGRRAAAQRLSPQTREALSEAHAAWREGRWADAAQHFQRLGMVARQRQLPRIASWLFSRAAVAAARAGDRQGFATSAEEGLADAKTAGDPKTSSRTYGELLAGLQGTAFADAVPSMQEAFRAQLGVVPRVAGDRRPVNRAQLRNLPNGCEVCGAPVSPEGLTVAEDGHLDCGVCGSELL